MKYTQRELAESDIDYQFEKLVVDANNNHLHDFRYQQIYFMGVISAHSIVGIITPEERVYLWQATEALRFENMSAYKKHIEEDDF